MSPDSGEHLGVRLDRLADGHRRQWTGLRSDPLDDAVPDSVGSKDTSWTAVRGETAGLRSTRRPSSDMQPGNVTRAQMQRPERDSIAHPVGLLIAVGGLVAVDGAHGYDEGMHQPDVVQVGVEGANVLRPAGTSWATVRSTLMIHRLTRQSNRPRRENVICSIARISYPVGLLSNCLAGCGGSHRRRIGAFAMTR